MRFCTSVKEFYGLHYCNNCTSIIYIDDTHCHAGPGSVGGLSGPSWWYKCECPTRSAPEWLRQGGFWNYIIIASENRGAVYGIRVYLLPCIVFGTTTINHHCCSLYSPYFYLSTSYTHRYSFVCCDNPRIRR
jgi:hypothetical protein